MIVEVDVDVAQFGEDIEKETIKDVAQDIIDRYCNVNYYNLDELRLIVNNQF